METLCRKEFPSGSASNTRYCSSQESDQVKSGTSEGEKESSNVEKSVHGWVNTCFILHRCFAS